MRHKEAYKITLKNEVFSDKIIIWISQSLVLIGLQFIFIWNSVTFDYDHYYYCEQFYMHWKKQ